MNLSDSLSRVVVRLNDAPLALDAGRALGAVRVQQALSVPALCELRFLAPRFDSLGEAVPGASVVVGIAESDEPLFAGEITAVEDIYGPSGERELRVRAYDRLHRLRQRQPVRSHVDVTPVELLRELVADLGLSVEASVDGPVWRRLIQDRDTDFDLLSDIAERCGLYFHLHGDTVQIATLEGSGDEVPLRLGQSLLEVTVEVNGDSLCRSVNAIGWDPQRVERRDGRADQPRLGRRVDAQMEPSRLGGSGERILVGETVQDDRQAEAMAQALLDVRAAREVTLSGVAQGDPALRPGTAVLVDGVSATVRGRYVLTAVTHVIDGERGYQSDLSTSPPPRRSRRGSTLAAFGLVSQIDDPEGAGRVRVSLPAHGDLETDWLAVLASAAGAGKGFVALPDVGDSVLVLFANFDLAQGVVLGGLYGMGSAGDWDWGIDQGAVKRFGIVTPGGQRLRLDDAGKLLSLENSDGSRVELSPDKVVLHSTTDLEIAAPGRSIVIRGRSIDFVSA